MSVCYFIHLALIMETSISFKENRCFTHQVSKFEESPSSKSLPFSLITNCKEVMKIRKIVKKLMQRCERLSKELETFVSDLMGKTDIEETEEGYITKQPKLLSKR